MEESVKSCHNCITKYLSRLKMIALLCGRLICGDFALRSGQMMTAPRKSAMRDITDDTTKSLIDSEHPGKLLCEDFFPAILISKSAIVNTLGLSR